MRCLWLISIVALFLVLSGAAWGDENGGQYKKQDSPYLEMPSGAYLHENVGYFEMIGGIGDHLTRDLHRSLLMFRQAGVKRVNIILSTDGGEPEAAMAMVQLLRKAQGDGMTVSITGYGKVLSAGVIVLQGASPGYRRLARDSNVMMHELQIVTFAFGYFKENVSQQAIGAQKGQFMQYRIYEFLGRHIGKTIEEVAALFKDDLWMTPERAVELKLADEVF